ncbi:hypothetical protein [Streptomyces goshikiensis]
MSETTRYQVTKSRYYLTDSLPEGRLIWVDEEPGRADVQILRGHATKAFVDHMTREHEYILGGGVSAWSQYWTPGEARAEGEPLHLDYARARWALSPTGDIAVALEQDGGFVWVIREGHVDPLVVEAFNKILLRLVGDGLWRQDFEENAPSGSAADQAQTAAPQD